jgi:hypothetical protein
MVFGLNALYLVALGVYAFALLADRVRATDGVPAPVAAGS